MKSESLQTIEGIFEFRRPTQAYKEMYGMHVRDVKKFNTLGLLPSIILAFLFVVAVAFGLSQLERAFAMSSGDAIRSFFGIESTYAAEKPPIRDESYSARYVGQSLPDPIIMRVGETKTIDFSFQNTGNHTWYASGAHPVTAFTLEPRYRDSLFQSADWRGSDQVAAIRHNVAPGDVGILPVTLTATEVGTFREYFNLAVYNHTWMKGGLFYLDIQVLPETAVVEEQKDAVADVPLVAGEEIEALAGKRAVQSRKKVSVKGGGEVKLVLAFQNIGTDAWSEYSLVSPQGTALAADSVKVSFGDDSWKTESVVLNKKVAVAPEGIVRETIVFRAPAKKGEYTATFFLQAGDTVLQGTRADVSVHVTSDAPNHYKAPKLKKDVEEVFSYRLEEEPWIRVGVQKLTDPAKPIGFHSEEADYRVFAGAHERGILKSGQVGAVYFAAGVYTFDSPDVAFESFDYIRLEPIDNDRAMFTLDNFERYVTWKGPVNFNKYRGAFELRKTDDGNNKFYVINEILLEDYVAGNAETSNVANIEYIKALHVAYRTYAYYIKENTTKHDSRHFDVVAHTGDQLYLGAASEMLMDRVAQAARDTRAMVITYDGDIVITPYFANTDGRTRSWTEVWGGSDKPWLQSVPAIYDKRDGKKLYGHGVGMSARDAAWKAEEEGKTWEELVKYYYTGVGVEQLFE